MVFRPLYNCYSIFALNTKTQDAQDNPKCRLTFVVTIAHRSNIKRFPGNGRQNFGTLYKYCKPLKDQERIILNFKLRFNFGTLYKYCKPLKDQERIILNFKLRFMCFVFYYQRAFKITHFNEHFKFQVFFKFQSFYFIKFSTR